MKALLVKVEVNGVKFEKVCHSVFEATKALMAIMEVKQPADTIDVEIADKYCENIMRVKNERLITFRGFWFSVKAIEVE